VTVLAVNCGGATLKYRLYQMPQETVLCWGLADRLFSPGAVLSHHVGEKVVRRERAEADHRAALDLALPLILRELPGGRPDAIAHKLAHAGADFRQPCLITGEVLEAMRRVTELVPLHNPPSMKAIEVFDDLLPGVPQVGVFETGFHLSVPPEAYLYGVPYEWTEQYGVRKYGFHGTSHRYVTCRVASRLGKPVQETNLISCHLGSGTSVCAVEKGRSKDISSGLTPQSGTIMSTRPGDFDAALIPLLMQRTGMSVNEVFETLHRRGGLLGISGLSGDFRDLEKAAAQGHRRARLALDVFVYQIRRYIGQYLVLLDRLDALCFTGGIGERSARLRREVCRGLERFGLVLDEERNEQAQGESRLSADGSPASIWVIPTDEEIMVAREAAALLQPQR